MTRLSDDRIFDVDIKIVHKTAKAVLVHPLGRPHDEIWIPLSCCSGVDKVGTQCCLGVSAWFCEKNGIDPEDWQVIE